MIRQTIGIRALKNSASRVIDEVAERGQEYVVTNHGKPVAVLRPWREDDGLEERARRLVQIMAEAREIAERVAKEAAAAGITLTAEEVVSGQRR